MADRASRRVVTGRTHALTLGAGARERAVDELASKAARRSRDGQKDEVAGLRAAARLLRFRPFRSEPRPQPSGAGEVIRAGAPCRTSPELDQCRHEPAPGRVSG